MFAYTLRVLLTSLPVYLPEFPGGAASGKAEKQTGYGSAACMSTRVALCAASVMELNCGPWGRGCEVRGSENRAYPGFWKWLFLIGRKKKKVRVV